MSTTSFPAILTLEQAASYLQLSPDELRRELESGCVPGVLVAGKWRVNREALDQLFKQPSETSQVVSKATPDAADTSREPEKVPLPTAEGASLVPADRGPDIASEPDLLQQARRLLETQTTTGTGTASQQASPIMTAPAKGRIRGRVFSYNREQGYGYARLPDNRVVWLDSKHLREPVPQPFPGDTVEFELRSTRNGLEGRAIQIAPVAGKKQASMAVSAKIAPPVSKPKKARSQPKLKRPSKASLVQPKKKPPFKGTKKSQSLYQKAAVARAEGHIEDARRFFRQSIETGAGTQVYEAFAKMERERMNLAEVREILQAGIDLFPGYTGFYIQLGQTERRSRNYARAEKIFRQGLKRFPNHRSLSMGLAQTLVQIETEESWREAGKIFGSLDKRRKLNKSDGIYQRFNALQSNPRAKKAYDFFKVAGMDVGIAGRRNLPLHITDLAVEMSSQELGESFGLSGDFLVRCFRRQPRQIEIVDLSRYLRDFGVSRVLGLQERKVVINSSLAFVAIPNSDAVRDQIMSILSESSEALVPLDDALLSESDEPLQKMRDVLGQYLGLRDLYSSTLPVSGRRFFGRERLLLQLTDQIQNGQFIGIYGLRKIGKTSLLYQLRDEKLRGEAVAYVDLQASAALTMHDCTPLYWELERDLYLRLREHCPRGAELLRLGKLDRFSDLPDSGAQTALFFAEDIRAFLDQVAAGAIQSVQHLVIILDELERILPVAGQDGIKGYLEFFGLLRGLAQTERYRGLISSVVVAANAAISERGYWEGRENPVFALYKPIFLVSLSEDECNEMIVTLGKGMSVYWEDDAIQAIFAETAGHPFLTRSFCSHIAKRHPMRPLTVTAAIVREQINPFIRNESDKLEQITELLRVNFPEEETFLEQMALDEAPSDLPDESLRHLLGYKLIALDDGSGYQVTLNLLRRWLRRRAGVRDE